MLESLGVDITVLLRTMRVTYRKLDLLKSMSTIFELNTFGILVVGLSVKDYGQVVTTLNNRYKEHTVVYVTSEDSLVEKKEELFWELMRSGYMTYLRSNYPRQFKDMISLQNLDKRIINKRLEIWGDKDRYKWLVEENKAALNESTSFVLSMNPGFYDYMP